MKSPWINEYYAPGLYFCKKSCVNKYVKIISKEPCDYCKTNHGTRKNYTYNYLEFGSKECKEKYKISLRPVCFFCKKKHGTRTYKYNNLEFNSKACKEKYIKRQKLYKKVKSFLKIKN